MLGKIFVFFYRLVLYLLTAILAVCSAGFTVLFYIEGQNDIYMLLIFLLAITFETLKVILAIAYPYMKYRQLEIEKSVKIALNICLLLSILASIYFFLGSKQDISPATKIVNLFYQNFDFNYGRVQLAFILNMSLSIMIEVFIIKIPQYATIFRFKPDENRKEFVVKGTLSKLLTIPQFIIHKKVNEIYQKYCKELIEQKEIENTHVEEFSTHENEKTNKENIKIKELEKKDTKLIAHVEDSGNEKIETKNTHVEKNPKDDTVKNEHDLLMYFHKIKNKDKYVEKTNKEIIKALNITSYTLRKFKENLIKSGDIEIHGNKTYIKGRIKRVK